MNRLPHSQLPAGMRARLQETRAAFDSVAPDYDGPRGNNSLIQDMRTEMWRWLDTAFPQPARLIDLGCGTGLDAVRMAGRGHMVTATDWSPLMVQRTRDRVATDGLGARVHVENIGGQDLASLEGDAAYDGVYSNLGPLNCVPDLHEVSRQCARLVRSGGKLVFTVVGRVCPWEIAHYLARGRWRRATVRLKRGSVPVGMNNHTIWTQYYGPREFFRAFRGPFDLRSFRGVCVFAPPPYLTAVRERHPRLYDRLWQLDRLAAGWPLLRGLGDHFLIVLERQ